MCMRFTSFSGQTFGGVKGKNDAGFASNPVTWRFYNTFYY